MRLILFLLFFPTICFSQESNILVKGYLIDVETNLILKEALIVNKSNGNFIYTDSSGNFSLKINRSDELIFSAQGYEGATLSFRDSITKPNYLVEVRLNRYKIKIKEVTIIAKKEIKVLKQELEALSYNYSSSKLKEKATRNSIQSPITALYTRWNKREKSKSKLSTIKYKDQLRTTLIKLFHSGNLSEVNELTPEKRFRFANYLAESEKYFLFNTQYELLAFVNTECRLWKKMINN